MDDETWKSLIKKVFDEYDKNGDGVLDRVESWELLKKVEAVVSKSKFEADYSSLNSMFQKIDINGDGKISFEELYSMLKDKKPK